MEVEPIPDSNSDHASSAPRALRGRALREAMVVLGYPDAPPGESARPPPQTLPPSAPPSASVGPSIDEPPASSRAPRALHGEELRRVLASLESLAR